MSLILEPRSALDRRARPSSRSVRRALVVGVLLAGCSRSEATAKDKAPASAAAPEGANSARSHRAPSAVSVANRASAAPCAEVSCITPESVGVSALPSLSGETAAEKAAVIAARHELSRLLEVPAEYFGNVQTAGDLVLLELWHRSSFPPAGCVAPGSSGGKRRTLSYDPRRQRIVSSKVWEPESELGSSERRP